MLKGETFCILKTSRNCIKEEGVTVVLVKGAAGMDDKVVVEKHGNVSAFGHILPLF